MCRNQGVVVVVEGRESALLSQLHKKIFDPFNNYGPTALLGKDTLCVGSANGLVLLFRAHVAPQAGSGAAHTTLQFDYLGDSGMHKSPIVAMTANAQVRLQLWDKVESTKI